jgi:hypothetical protein
MRRQLPRALPILAVGVLMAVHADAAEPHRTGRPPAGFELLAVGSVGTSTWIPELRIDPYGAGIGLDAGYVFGFGFRIGAYVGYGLGRTITQDYAGVLGAPGTVTTSASNVGFGVSVAYDMPLYGLLLRYSLGLGATVIDWSVRPPLVGRGLLRNDPTSGFHVAPAVTLLWPIGRYECGAGVRYLIQVADTMPDGIVGELLMGVRL